MKVGSGAIVALFWCLAANADEGSVKVTQLLSSHTDVLGHPVKLSADDPLFSGKILELPPSFVTALHFHPEPMMAYVLEGELEVKYNGERKIRYRKGDMFIEAINTLHRGKALMPSGARLLILNITEEQDANSVSVNTAVDIPEESIADVLSAALAFRLKLSEAIARSNFHLGAAVQEPDLEVFVLEGFLGRAAQAGLSRDMSEAFILGQIEASKTLQETYLARAKAEGLPKRSVSVASDLMARRKQLDQLDSALINLLLAVGTQPLSDKQVRVLSHVPLELEGHENAWKIAVAPFIER